MKIEREITLISRNTVLVGQFSLKTTMDKTSSDSSTVRVAFDTEIPMVSMQYVFNLKWCVQATRPWPRQDMAWPNANRQFFSHGMLMSCYLRNIVQR
jgi:hypothetical protein